MSRNVFASPSGELHIRNDTDAAGNPAGGYVHGVGLCIAWQDGPRGQPDGSLSPANGAFVEDAILAAWHRLTFFQTTRFACEANTQAIAHLDAAIAALTERARQRNERGVLGTHQE